MYETAGTRNRIIKAGHPWQPRATTSYGYNPGAPRGQLTGATNTLNDTTAAFAAMLSRGWEEDMREPTTTNNGDGLSARNNTNPATSTTSITASIQDRAIGTRSGSSSSPYQTSYTNVVQIDTIRDAESASSNPVVTAGRNTQPSTTSHEQSSRAYSHPYTDQINGHHPGAARSTATTDALEPSTNIPSPPRQNLLDDTAMLEAKIELQANHELALRARSQLRAESELKAVKEENEALRKRASARDAEYVELYDELQSTKKISRDTEGGLTQQVNNYRTKCETLERELASQKPTALRTQLQAAQANLEYCFQEYRTRCEVLSTGLKQALWDLSQKETQFSELQHKSDRFENKNRNLAAMLTESETIISSLEGRSEKAEHNLKWAKIYREEDRAVQKEVVAGLEQKLKDIQPLVDIGVAIRLRFLEQAREVLYGLRRAEMDNFTIQSGNIAAHRANSIQDVALFKCKLIDPEYRSEMWDTFKQLYKVTPLDYPQSSPRMERINDCEATLKALKPARSPAVFERIEYDQLRTLLLNLHAEMDRDAFENNDLVRGKVQELECITERINEAERSRFGRR